MKLLFAFQGWPGAVDRIAAGLPAGTTIARSDPRRPLAEQLGDVDVLLPSGARVDEALLAQAPRLRLVQQPATGVENIDLEAARRRGVPVCNVVGHNASSVAQVALLLILALARRLKPALAAFERALIGQPTGLDLEGKRLLVVGLGRSGSRLAAAAGALGMEVRGLTSRDGPEALDEGLGWADVVSLHCPLTPRTRGLIDARALGLMRPGALLVNVSRGPVIDRAAVEAAITSGHLGGLGLDVYWDEPWDPSDPLYAHPAVVTLPHIGGTTTAAFERLAQVVVENVVRLRDGRPLIHRLV